jgi:hypothetical protein
MERLVAGNMSCQADSRSAFGSFLSKAFDQETRPYPFSTSSLPMPAKLPARTFPGHYLVRRVSNAGTFRFQPRQLFMSITLLQEDIALEEAADGIWSISFYDVLLARLDARDFRLYA